MKVTDEVEQRFWSKVQKTATCWDWTASLRSGYGVVRIDGTQLLAHRVAYEILVENIEPGMVIDHLCRNTKCVNPEHLEVVTVRENTLRGKGITAELARQTCCLNGHPFNEENTYTNVHGRHCRKCRKETTYRWRKARNEVGSPCSELNRNGWPCGLQTTDPSGICHHHRNGVLGYFETEAE